MDSSASATTTRLLVSWRGDKVELPLSRGSTTVGSLKAQLANSVDESLGMSAGDVRILYRGRVLVEDTADLYDLVVAPAAAGGKKPLKTVRLMATGASVSEIEERDRAFEEGVRSAPRIQDDLTDRGAADLARRREEGRRVLADAAMRSRAADSAPQHGFGRIEILPNLPDQDKAREILASLSNDPGILACMAKHNWNVGCLSEMFPEGKVGQDEVCVMGLNQNKGQKILLRIRTDDLKGFRKTLSIRKVLFHELAHNLHSEHDENFFMLMRQIEKECNEMDWTRGSGSTTGGTAGAYRGVQDPSMIGLPFQGGTHRLGGASEVLSHRLPARDLAARAAMMRLTAEEEEIRNGCGCGRSSGGGNSDKNACKPQRK